MDEKQLLKTALFKGMDEDGIGSVASCAARQRTPF